MTDLVVLRPEGLYCPAGDFHIDPWKPVPRAVITHGHGDHARRGMGMYYTTPGSLPILQWRLGEQDYRVHAYGDSFVLGDARVSLHSAGHVLGSAQVRIEVDGEVWVCSGDYKRQPDPTCAPFEVVPCDTFITEATFGLPIYRWPDTSDVVADIAAWRPRLRRIAWICLPIGFVLSAVHGSGRMGIEAGPLLRAAVTAVYVGLPVMAMGYAALFTLWLSGKGKWLQRGLTPMGRMALTGYLASNLIGGFIWYGWGLGLMGQINVAGMAAIGLAIFVALCVFSAVWLKQFPQGPAEALWRRLSGRRSRPV